MGATMRKPRLITLLYVGLGSFLGPRKQKSAVDRPEHDIPMSRIEKPQAALESEEGKAMDVDAIQGYVIARDPGFCDLLVGQQIDLRRLSAAEDHHFAIGIGKQIAEGQSDGWRKIGVVHRGRALGRERSLHLVSVAWDGHKIIVQIEKW
jgi:hypothetical protein